MAKSTTDTSNVDNLLQERQVKALEKIANSLDALTIWFEEIDKEEWDARIQWYLSEWYRKYISGE
jgi:hypothetical protein